MRQRVLVLISAIAVACGHSAPKPAPKTINMEPEVVTARLQPPANPDAAPLPLWPEVHKGTLPNGLTYYILKHGKPEHRAMLWLAVDAGSVDEDDDQRGLAHFDEHMAFNGTKRFPHLKIVDYLEKNGMRFGADLNAYTTWQETVYQLEVPTDKPDVVGTGLDILRDWAGDVTYDPTEVEKERGVVLEEWRRGLGPSKRLRDKQAQVIFAGSRYADRITIGLPEIIQHAPRDTLYRFYKDWYRPDLMAVIVVGDVDVAKMEQDIRARFSDLKNPAGERKNVVAGVPRADGTRVSIEVDHEVPGTSVEVMNLVAHRPVASKNDMRRLTIESVYSSIMNERFAQLRRQHDAPFMSAFAGARPLVREIDAFTRAAQVKEGRVEDALRELMIEVLRAERHGFSQAELDRARLQIARDYEELEAREATRDSRAFTSEIVRNFLQGELMVGSKAEKELTLAILPTITIDDLNAAVKSFGADQNRVITISGPDGSNKASGLPTKERVLAILAEVANQDIPPWQDKPVPTTLMAKPPTPGKIVREKKIDAIGVTEWTLGNGARVVVKPTDYENDTIVIGATAPGGSALASDKDFDNAQFAVEAANTGGVADFDADTLGKILTGKQIRADVRIGEVTEGVRGQSSQKDLETAFQLLYLKLTAPRKDVDQFHVWQDNLAERLANLDRLPDFAFFKNSNAAEYNNNVRHRVPTVDEVKHIDLDKALAFYRARFADFSDFTFVIVGSVELAKLRPLVETYLASLPGKHRVEREKDVGVRKVRGVVEKEWKLGEEPKAHVEIDFHGDDTWTRDKDRDMDILSRVATIRLREVLREDLGGVYSIGASGQLARSPHQERSFAVQFGCDPTRVDELVAALFREIDKLANGPKTKPADADGKDKKDLPISDNDLDEYLAKVKETFLRERETSMRTNKFWVDWLENSYRYGDDPTLVLDPSKKIARMTVANVRAAAKHYLDRKQYYQAVMVPAKAVPAVSAPPLPGATSKLPHECRELQQAIEKLGRCDKAPAKARDAMVQSLEAMKKSWANVDAMPPAAIDALRDGCKAGLDGLKQGAASMGC